MEEERRNQAMAEITALKSLLRDSDYQIIKLAENMTDCKSATALWACFREFLAEFGVLVQSRRDWRTKINELETFIDSLTEQQEQEP